jgi:hypothetical protein
MYEIIALSSEIAARAYRQSYFKQFEKFYISEINSALSQFDIDLVVYDEVEYFRQYFEDDFDYPYTLRKNVIETFKFNFTKEDLDYTFTSSYMKFIKSAICLEEPFYNQIFFLQETINEISQQIIGVIGLGADIVGVDTDNSTLSKVSIA